MTNATILDWPSGDCKPVLATLKTADDLAAVAGETTFRDCDDLDWFDAATLRIDALGPVLIMKHDNNALNLTVLYVDNEITPSVAEDRLIQFFGLATDEVEWRLSDHV